MAEKPIDDKLMLNAASSELSEILHGIIDLETSSGAPRFMPRDGQQLVVAVVGRAYGQPLFELAHLIAIASACGRGADAVPTFFWDPMPARPAAFRGLIDQRLRRHGWRRPGFAATAEGVEATYADGKFLVTYARMPFLAALMEFLTTTIGYPVVEDTLRGRTDTVAGLSDAANTLARSLYNFLKDHLPPPQRQRKLRRLLAFLATRQGDTFDATAAIDDDLVLRFWQAECAADDGADFRTFEGVYRFACDVVPLLAAAATAGRAADARSLGKEREAGEIDPDTIAEVLWETAGEDRANPLTALRAPPADRVKFLTGTEIDGLGLLGATMPQARRLPLSLLRAEVFGAAQRRIGEALRRQDPNPVTKVLDDLSEDYADRIDRYLRLARQIEKIQLAALHALARAGSEAAIDLALAIAPDLDLRQWLEPEPEESGTVVPFPGVAARFVGAVAEAEGSVGDLGRAARRAFQSISRQGFREGDTLSPAMREAFEEGARLLAALRQDIDAFLACLPTTAQDALMRRYAEDRAVFARQFALLYGEPT